MAMDKPTWPLLEGWKVQQHGAPASRAQFEWRMLYVGVCKQRSRLLAPPWCHMEHVDLLRSHHVIKKSKTMVKHCCFQTWLIIITPTYWTRIFTTWNAPGGWITSFTWLVRRDIAHGHTKKINTTRNVGSSLLCWRSMVYGWCDFCWSLNQMMNLVVGSCWFALVVIWPSSPIISL